MKWLKLFEGFQETEYYKVISEDDYNDELHVRSNHESWTNVEKEHVKNFKIKGQFPNIHDPFMYNYLYDETGRKFRTDCFFVLNKDEQITAFKMKDEWIICEWTSLRPFKRRFYKCDQIGGFEQLLNDINEKIPD